MAIVFDSDAGTISGLSVGGLPDGIVDGDMLAANAITAGKIVDGTIVNADINSSAAIAGSKISGSFGKVLQVVQTSYNTQTTFTSSSAWVAHGATATITPSSTSSKILMSAQIHRIHDQMGGTDSGLGFMFKRGTTVFFETPVAIADYVYPGGGSERHEKRGWVNLTKIDSPSTTSATTYALWAIKYGGGTIKFQDSQNETIITLMEIAG
jgi:hypothetical protein